MDKHAITEYAVRLFKQAIADANKGKIRGGKAAFSRMSGISPDRVSKLISGKKKFVFGDEWNRICDIFPELDDREDSARANKKEYITDPFFQIVHDNWKRLTTAQRGKLATESSIMAEENKGVPPPSTSSETDVKQA